MHSPLIGERVTGQVIRILANKVLIQLDDGRIGVIRRRELSWENPHIPPQKAVTIGETITAIVIDHDPEHDTLELSLRLVKRDPWKEFAQHHTPGDTIVGVVRRVRHFGAFVEVQKGIEGFLPVREITFQKKGAFQAQEILWPGDWVKAVISELDPQKYRLKLSIREILLREKEKRKRQRHAAKVEETLLEHLSPRERQQILELAGALPKQISWPSPGRLRRILVVDDNDPFRQSVVRTLKEWGYQVADARNHNEALQKSEETPFDLAILDLLLSTGHSLDLAQKIKQRHPQTHFLMLCGRIPPPDLVQEIEAEGFILECKPFGPEALADHLRYLEEQLQHTELASSSAEGQKLAPPPSRERPVSTVAEASKEDRERGWDTKSAQRILAEIKQTANADSAILFQETSQGITIVEESGSPVKEIQGEEKLTLKYSPVGDVFEEQRLVRIADAERAAAQTKYLRQLLTFRSALGLPLRVRGVSAPYALFLFAHRPHAFPRNLITHLKPLLDELAAVLLQQHLLQALLKTQHEVLLSRLQAGALHDVRNTLGALEFHLHRLYTRLNEAEDADTFLSLRAELQLLVREIEATTGQMQRTLKLFQELVSERDEVIVLNHLIHRSVERLRPLAKDMNVSLHFIPDQDIPMLRLPPLHLQQAVENVLLNAVQWSTGRPIHQVEVITSYVPEAAFPVQIRISDTGPGIHAQWQASRIYEIGFSTRKEGTGLGLFIARTLIEGIGGQIKVEESFMELGTTFLIALPGNA